MSAMHGMGEVYRARDTRLKRDVAIKVLPASFSADPDRLQCFAQESRAALNLATFFRSSTLEKIAEPVRFRGRAHDEATEV